MAVFIVIRPYCSCKALRRKAGGHCYDVLRPDDGRVFVAVGDVSGKGIPVAWSVAWFMVVTTTLLRKIARQHRRPEELLLPVNDALAV